MDWTWWDGHPPASRVLERVAPEDVAAVAEVAAGAVPSPMAIAGTDRATLSVIVCADQSGRPSLRELHN
jgi:hypothetical protein